MGKQPSLSDVAIRSVAAGLLDAAGNPVLPAGGIGDVVVEDDWAAVVLDKPDTPQATLSELQRALAQAFAGATIEVRAGHQIHRGGAGFGPGKHVLAVFGGKGGVGKSTLSVNLALTLAAMGLRVGVLDGDLSAPDLPHLLGVHPKHPPQGLGWQLWGRRPVPPRDWHQPYERYGVEVMSVGFVVPERLPVEATGRMLVSALLRHLIFAVAWSCDVLVVDAPPGTGTELQVMAQELPLSGAVFVTTPQDLAQMDAERTLTLLTEHGVPVIGLVQNMASLTCPHCARPIDMFAASPRLTDAGLAVLGRIPFDVRLSVGADRGVPLVLSDGNGPVAYEFARIAHAVRRWLAAQS